MLKPGRSAALRRDEALTMAALARNWWMIAIRGALAIVFGVTVLMWPKLTLADVVILFGVYAIVDGAWAIAAALRAAARFWSTSLLALEGGASITLGLLAVIWPRVPREAVWILAAWGLITGVLELAAAWDVPSTRPACWLLLTGGASSLFLAVLVLLLPYAGFEAVERVIAAYAQVFGVVMLLAALDFPRHTPDAGGLVP